MKQALEYLIGDFLERDLPELTRRDFDLEPVSGKALALVGMRRVGKTFLCYQAMQALLESGMPKDNLLYLNFEDDRLYGFELGDCQTILDVFYAQRPGKKSERCAFFFDEIQNVPHWERFIRRLIDTENVSVYITGSSSRLLSSEIATAMRGRSLDREVFTLSFQEFLRTQTVSVNLSRVGSKTRLLLNQQAEAYCRIGGFPEIQSFSVDRRREILQSYVDAVVLRDVVERHGVSNVEALRMLVYHVLRNPTTKLSVNKFYLDLKSRGIRIAKDDLYAFLRHLTDAFLLFPVPLCSTAEKTRQVNPKKIYVIDNGVLDAYSTNLTPDQGAFLENLVFLTLRQRGLEIGYYLTQKGREIDFVYRLNGQTFLIQVAWTMENVGTKERELRALKEAAQELRQPKCVVVTLNEEWTSEEDAVEVVPLWKFLLWP